MPERDKDTSGALWSEALRGLADIRSKLMAGWFGRDPDSPRAGDLGWTIGNGEASRARDPSNSPLDRLYQSHPEHFVSEPDRGQQPPSIASGWAFPSEPARDGPGRDIDR